MSTERCVSCGAPIPEGRQVCPMCEAMVYDAAPLVKQFDKRDFKDKMYTRDDVKKPESSGCGIVMTAKGPVMTK